MFADRDFCANEAGDRLLDTGDGGVRLLTSTGDRGERGDLRLIGGSGGDRGRRRASIGERGRRTSGDLGDRLRAIGDVGERRRSGDLRRIGDAGGDLRDRLRLLRLRLYRNVSRSLSELLSPSMYIFL